MPSSEKKSQPLESEIREFWEWCGFKFIKDRYGWGQDSWLSPLGEILTQLPTPELPTPDLNNLFKYAFGTAVRKLTDEHNYAETYAIDTIMNSWRLEAGDNIPDANALFQTIWEVIKK